MADAIAAFRESWSSYKKSLSGYATYSLVASIFGLLLAGLVAVAGTVLFFLILGSASSLSTLLSFTGVGLFIAIIILLIGLLVFLWLLCGIKGAYLETLNGFLSGRPQTIAGFASLVPKKAGTMFGIALLHLIIAGVPFGALALLSTFFSGLIQIAVVSLGAMLAALLSLFFTYAYSAAVSDNKRAVDSVKTSFVTVAKNPVSTIIFLIVAALLSIPGTLLSIIGIGVLYTFLFMLPLSEAALLLLYKRSR